MLEVIDIDIYTYGIASMVRGCLVRNRQLVAFGRAVELPRPFPQFPSFARLASESAISLSIHTHNLPRKAWCDVGSATPVAFRHSMFRVLDTTGKSSRSGPVESKKMSRVIRRLAGSTEGQVVSARPIQLLF